MFIYISCLLVFFFVISFLMSKRYGCEFFSTFSIGFFSFVASLVIIIIALIFTSNYYGATIEDQFPEEFATYSANEDKLWEFELLNDEGMLNDEGKAKVLELTEFNVDLYAELERKLLVTDANIKYEKTESLIVNSVFTVIYSLFFGFIIVITELDIRDEKKKKLINLLRN